MKEYLAMSGYFIGNVTINAEGHICDDKYFRGSTDIAEDYYEPICHAINSHDELVEMNKELLSELKAMAKAYVNLMESGKDRIESLGGDCDEVAYMAAHDANLVHACSVIGKYDGGAA